MAQHILSNIQLKSSVVNFTAKSIAAKTQKSTINFQQVINQWIITGKVKKKI